MRSQNSGSPIRKSKYKMDMDKELGPNLIVLLCGKRKCGKDFVANLLKKIYRENCELLHLSEPIKKHFSRKYNYELDQLMSNKSIKENIRREMIKWGEDQRKNIDPYIFCKNVVECVRNSTQKANLNDYFPWIWIVVDCRRKTDIQYFYNNFKCKIICVKICSNIKERSERGFIFIPGIDDAESECDLDTYRQWDFILENNCNHIINNDEDKTISSSFWILLENNIFCELQLTKSPNVDDNYQPSGSDQCIQEKFVNEVIFQGGIHAGNYIDVGKFLTDDQCLSKCCQKSLCDAVFMLNNTCYLVTCSTIASCTLQQAKPSQLKPKIAFVTRWNAEGVRRTLLGNDRQLPWENNTCPKMIPLIDVTLKNGLQAGVFTDSGKTDSLEDCYNVCCQRKDCNMAFLLADNCFTIKCTNTVATTINMNKVQVCPTEPAVKSSFNPRAAHVYSRIMFTQPTYPLNYQHTTTPNVKYYNSYDGKNWPTPPSFTANYNNIPYAYQPMNTFNTENYATNDLSKIQQPTVASSFNLMPTAPTTMSTPTNNDYSQANIKDNSLLNIKNIKDAMEKYNGFMFSPNIGILPINELSNASDTMVTTTTFSFNNEKEECPVTRIFNDVFLHEKYNSGKFVEVPSSIASNIFTCQEACCRDTNCDVVVMIAAKCYKIYCKDLLACQVDQNPTTTIYSGIGGWQIIFVRNVETKKILTDSSEVSIYQNASLKEAELQSNPEADFIKVNTPQKLNYFSFESPYSDVTQPPTSSPDATHSTVLFHNNITLGESNSANKLEDENSCMISPIYSNSMLRDSNETGITIKLADKVTIEKCIDLCCSMKEISIKSNTNTAFNVCHVALLVGYECFGVSCYSEESCKPIKMSNSDDNSVHSLVIVRNPPHTITEKKNPINNTHGEGAPNKSNQDILSSTPTKTPLISSTTVVEPTFTNYNKDTNCYHEEISSNKTIVAVTMLSNGVLLPNNAFDEAIRVLSGSIDTLDKCVKLCCENDTCDAAVLHNERCLSVECSSSPALCKTTSKPINHSDSYPLISLVKRNKVPSTGNMLSAQVNGHSQLFSKQNLWLTISASCLCVVVCCLALFSVMFYRRNYLKRKNKHKNQKLPKLRDIHPRKPSSLFQNEENILEELLNKASKSKHIKPPNIKHYKK